MFDLKKLREDLSGINADIEALQATAATEKRELTEEENGKVDAALASAGKLQAQIQRAEQHEAVKATLALKQTHQEPDAPRISFPGFSGRLKAFRGETAQQDAYLCGKFVLATMLGNSDARQFCRDNGVQILNAMHEQSNTAGGYLVPTQMEAAIARLREEYGVFRQNADVRSMVSDSQVFPKALTGLTAYAVADNDEVTASDKTWGQVEVTARKWGVLARWSSELNEDAVIQMADDLASEIGIAFAVKEDQSGFKGDGTSTYHGVFGVSTKINDGNHAASIASAASGNVSFETLDDTDFLAAIGKLPQYPGIQPKWYISKPGFYASMGRLAAAAGGNSKDEFAGGISLQYQGYPVVLVPTGVLNETLGSDVSAIKCLFGDLRLSSILGDRRGTSIKVSVDRYFEYDQLGILGTTRFGINNHSLGDGSTAGPIIAVKTAAS